MEFSPSYPAVPSREYLELPPSCHPILSDGYKIRPSLVAVVRAQSFSGKKDECPYAHLQIFEENCSLLIILLALLKYPFYPLFIFDNGMNLISKSLTVPTPA